MANEITQTITLALNNGALQTSRTVTKQKDQVNARISDRTIVVTTSGTVIDFDNLLTPCDVLLKNMDEVNFVDVGPESGGVIVPLARLKPGDAALVPLAPDAVLRAQADTSNVLLQVFACDM